MKLKSDASREKLRGGFYTPAPIAEFILQLISRNRNIDRILEPSCGDGAFLRSLYQLGVLYNTCTAIELDEEEARKASALNIPNTRVISTDFYQYCLNTNEQYDVIIGNPPFIRYQFIEENQRTAAERIFEQEHLRYSKLMNTWVSFVVGCSTLLTEQGIMGFVIPAELLQVGYAKVLREYLTRHFNKVGFISFQELVFPTIQQEVLILICEKDGTNNHVISHVELNNEASLKSFDFHAWDQSFRPFNFADSKWTTYFLDNGQIDIVNRIKNDPRFHQLRDFANVEVGTTTGANSFFTVSNDIVSSYELYDYAHPLVGRSVQVSSCIFTHRDWEINNSNGVRSNFLLFPPLREIESPRVLEYLQTGQTDKIAGGYKCRIRDEWQIVPSAWVPDAFFIRRNNLFPRFIQNQAMAYTTDTMHRVTIRDTFIPEAVIASYYNSISFAFSELCGRSHGGGVLELMPNEVEDIILPYHPDNAELLPMIDRALRHETPIEELLNATDEIILHQHFGLDNDTIQQFRTIWRRLQQRRLNRN